MNPVIGEFIFSFVAAIATIVLIALPYILFDMAMMLTLSYASCIRYKQRIAKFEQFIDSRLFGGILYLSVLILAGGYFAYYKLQGIEELKKWISDHQLLTSHYTYLYS